MSQLQDRIAQLRKMANDDPNNELGHYSLGKLLMETGQFDEAVQSFRARWRSVRSSPRRINCWGNRSCNWAGAMRRWPHSRRATPLARERGDNIPRDEMGKMLTELGEAPPEPKKTAAPAGAPGDGFRCQRPGCLAGSRARKLPGPPLGVEKALGQKIVANVCADCWNDWLRNMSIKVINELRLDLSTERGAEEYDRYMREYLGLE